MQCNQNYLTSYVGDQLFGNASYSYSDSSALRWPKVNYTTFKDSNEVLSSERLLKVNAVLNETYVSSISNAMHFNRSKVKPASVIVYVTDDWRTLFAYKKSSVAGVSVDTYSNSVWGRFHVTEDERQDLIRDIERLTGFKAVMTGKFCSSGFSDVGYYYTVVTENKNQEEIDEIARMTEHEYLNELVYLKREVDTMINQVDPFTLRQIKNMIMRGVCLNRNCKTSVEASIKRYFESTEKKSKREKQHGKESV